MDASRQPIFLPSFAPRGWYGTGTSARGNRRRFNSATA
jgi:hypothetical protein